MSVVLDRAARIARAKSEIVAFIAAGTIPDRWSGVGVEAIRAVRIKEKP